MTNSAEGDMGVQKAWGRLLAVRDLSFEARSRAVPNTGWNGSGTGVVHVEAVGADGIFFHEKGAWTPKVGRQTTFNNVFRWTAAPEARLIRLEHLRFGPDNPVYLFDLVPAAEGVLEPSEPHVCREDLYAARMEFEQQAVRLRWTITGPKKAEDIVYTYR